MHGMPTASSSGLRPALLHHMFRRSTQRYKPGFITEIFTGRKRWSKKKSTTSMSCDECVGQISYFFFFGWSDFGIKNLVDCRCGAGGVKPGKAIIEKHRQKTISSVLEKMAMSFVAKGIYCSYLQYQISTPPDLMVVLQQRANMLPSLNSPWFP